MGPGWVTGPIPSADGQALQTIVRINLGTQSSNNGSKAADAIRAIADSNANGLSSHLTGPLTSHITGPLGISADLSKVFGGIDTTLLYSALAVVIVILLITYRSPVLWLLPVTSSVVALAVGGTTATLLDENRANAHDRDLVIPLILAVVFVILGLLLRALVAPLILTATVVLSFAAALGVSAVFLTTCSGSAAPTPRSRCTPSYSWSPWASTTTSS